MRPLFRRSEDEPLLAMHVVRVASRARDLAPVPTHRGFEKPARSNTGQAFSDRKNSCNS